MAFTVNDTPADFPDVEAPSAGETDLVLGGSTTSFPGRFVWQLARRTRFLYNLVAGDTTSQQTFEAFKQLGVASTSQGRLTLESGVPISSSDQLGAGTLYYTPYNGDYIALYDTAKSRWDLRQFGERSLPLSGLTANTNYDIFAFWNGSSVELEPVAWASSGFGSSSRSINLTQLNGVHVKNTDSRRYLGSIRTTVAGEAEDSVLKRFVWNANNRVARKLYSLEFSVHSYASSTFRPWDNSTTLVRVEMVVGLSNIEVLQLFSYVGFNNGDGRTAVGLNSTTSGQNDTRIDFSLQYAPVTGNDANVAASQTETPQLGANYAIPLESSVGTTAFSFANINGIFLC